MENKHKNIDQLDGNTSMDSDISCEHCEAKGKKENVIEDEGDHDELSIYFWN